VSSFLKYKLRRDRRVAELDINLIVRLGCDAGAEKPYSGFECQYLSQTTEFYFNKQHRQSGKVVNVVKGLSSGAEKLFAVPNFRRRHHSHLEPTPFSSSIVVHGQPEGGQPR
jgi:hypothetical protein